MYTFFCPIAHAGEKCPVIQKSQYLAGKEHLKKIYSFPKSQHIAGKEMSSNSQIKV